MKRKLLFILIDLILVFASFMLMAWIKPATVRVVLPTYWVPFIYFSLIWLFISIFIGKYNLDEAKSGRDVYVPITITNFTILAIITIMVYAFKYVFYSRLMVFGTIGVASILEVSLALTYYAFKSAVRIDEAHDIRLDGQVVIPKEVKDFKVKIDEEQLRVDKKLTEREYQNIKGLIKEEANGSVVDFIDRSIDLYNPNNLLISTTTSFNILNQPDNTYHNLVNLKRVNDFRRINSFFEAVNTKIPYGGVFIDRVETYVLRKRRILKKYPPLISYGVYVADWVWKRLFPKLPVTKRIYFFFSQGRKRVLSKAETFGRLYSCGFEVIKEELIENYLYFCARKIGEPAYPESPTYGPLIRLRRYGKDGKFIGVYKFRTMHPYSEYLQQYVYDNYNLEEGGKFKNDFRINTPGKYMRKFWIDELPMLMNIILRDMKIVGVRPLSKQYFDLYHEELKEKRIKHRPGLIPPFYVDLPKTLEEIQESEMKYLNAYEKSPLWTDTRYFFLALYNILIKRARSN